MSAALAGSPQGPGSSGAFACNPPLDAFCTRTMTLIRALPALTDTERPRNASVREQLQRLEDVAREELLELGADLLTTGQGLVLGEEVGRLAVVGVVLLLEAGDHLAHVV